MIDIEVWTKNLLQELQATFGTRLYFVGLQGSYGRGEATEKSDIDAVVILDELSYDDIHRYNAVMDRLPHRELICGFLSGKSELFAWEPSDLFALYYDTKPLFGALDDLLPLLDREAVRRAVRIGACNIYHACVHNALYEKSEDVLRALYKSASFTVRAAVFSRTGKYAKEKDELFALASADEKTVLEIFWELKNEGAVAFGQMSQNLFLWAKKQIEKA